MNKIILLLSIFFITVTLLGEKIQQTFIPFAFYNPSLNWSVSSLYAITNFHNKNSVIKTGAVFSINKDLVAYAIVENLRINEHSRFVFEPEIIFMEANDIKNYSTGNCVDENNNYIQAGNNNSNQNNYLDVEGIDLSININTKYLLPLGSGKNSSNPKSKIIKGFITENNLGGDTWNPLLTGLSYAKANFFYRNQDTTIKNNNAKHQAISTGIKLSLLYENFDYPTNPSKGSYQSISFIRDFGKFGSNVSWSVVQAEYEKVYTPNFKIGDYKPTFVLNFWSSNCLTWDEPLTTILPHNAPTFAGSTLGGKFRMKAFPEGRFNDKSAIYYSFEYRQILPWNPLDTKWLKRYGLNIDWLMLTTFSEFGRVNNNWNFKEFHEDMKWDAGLGLRFFLNDMVIRIDYAQGNEGGLVQMYYNHPFRMN